MSREGSFQACCSLTFLRSVCGSYACAQETADICRLVVSVTRWTTLKMLISNVIEYGRRMQEAKTSGTCCGDPADLKKLLLETLSNISCTSSEKNILPSKRKKS